MKVSIHILLSLYLFIPSLILAQEENYNYYNFNQSVGIQFNIGFNTFNSTNAEKYFEKSLIPLQERNVLVEAQTLYPSNILLGGGVYYFPTRSLSLSLVAEFTNTKAYSLYGDYAGTIDIKSTISFISICFGLQKHFIDIFIIQPYVGIDAGIVRGEYNYESKILFNDFPEYSHSDELIYSNIGFKAEGYIGASYNLDFVIVSLQGGYKYCLIPKPDREDVQGEVGSEDIPFDLETSGVVIKLSLRTGIFW